MELRDRQRIYSETLVPALQAEDQIFLLRLAERELQDREQRAAERRRTGSGDVSGR